MKGIFNSIRYGSPIFVYLSSLFILINFFGKGGLSVISVISFIICSIVILSFINNKRVKTIFGKIFSDSRMSTPMIIAEFLSMGLEIGITVQVFDAVSDANSDTFDNLVFSVVISVISLIIASAGASTVLKISNILFFLPLLAVIPCIISAVENGIDITSALPNSNVNIIYDLSMGLVLSLIFLSDYVIISSFQEKPSKTIQSGEINGTLFGIFYISALFMLLITLLGDNLYRVLIAPIFTAAGTVKLLESGEIILIIYSLCLLYRLSCKFCFISSWVNKRMSGKACKLILSLFPAIVSCIGGVLFCERITNYTLTSAIYAFIYLTAFILIPIFTLLFQKSK